MDIDAAINHYCNYQERSQKEVRNKLYELGCGKTEVEERLAELISSGLVNEQRYACSVATGKFRIKGWGRKKIVNALKAQHVSEYCIRKALLEIDTEEYKKKLFALAEKRMELLNDEKNALRKKQKFFTFLVQKGYETDLVSEVFQRLTTGSE